MSLSASLFGRDSFLHKATNILGLGIPGWLDRKFGGKDTPAIQSLGELAEQTARESEPRNIFYGCVRPVGGNIIHCQAPVTKWITTEVEGGGGGKGGGKKPKQKQSVQHVYRTYAIGVGEDITGYRRIWRNNKLVYDARGNEWGEKNNPIFLKTFVLYLGTWDQMPDPTLESIWGVGQVPAYRGTSYMVSINEDLTEFGGAVPQWIFEVVRAEGIFYTSKPYAVEQLDELELSQVERVRVPPSAFPVENLALGLPQVTAGSLRDPLIPYADWPPEGVTLGVPQITAGSLRTAGAIPYGEWTPEALALGAPQVTAGTLRNGLVSYQNWPVEALQLGLPQITGGSLT